MTEQTDLQVPSDGDAAKDALWEDVWKQRCNYLSVAYVTYGYHRKRQRFFDLLDKGTKALTVVLGGSLLGTAVRDLLPLIAAGISSLGLLALVFGYSDKKQSHKELAEAAMQQVGKIEATLAADINNACISGWAADQARLNSREPPSLSTLVTICEYERAVYQGYPDHIASPGWWPRLWAHFFSMDNQKIQRRTDPVQPTAATR